MTNDKILVPPADRLAEQSVLGSIFISNDKMVEVKEYITYRDFYDRKHQVIFKCFEKLYDDGIAIDATTVNKFMVDNNAIEQIGGISYLGEVINSTPTSTHAVYYAQIVQRDSIRRKLIQEGNKLIESAYEGDTSPDDLISLTEQTLAEIGDSSNNSGFHKIHDVLAENFAELELRSQQRTDITGVSTGYEELDKITTGLHQDELIILAARPAVGKTAFALNIAQNIATKSQKPVAIFSLEMGVNSLVERMLASESLVDAYSLRTGKLSEDEWVKITIAQARLAEAPIFIDDTAGIKISEIRGRSRRLAKEMGELGCIVIDYLQLITGTNPHNRQQEVSDISRQLKILAKELKVPVIALSQLSRNVEQRQDKRPVLSDIRESGSIEQDADIVAFLYRDDYYDRSDKETEEEQTPNNIVEVIIEKNRSGARGTVRLMFQKEYNKFSSISWREDGTNHG